MITQCPHCRQQYEVDDKYLNEKVFCPKCNKEFKAENTLIQCKSCGGRISKRAKRCVHCGDVVSPKDFIDWCGLFVLLVLLSIACGISTINPFGFLLFPFFLILVIRFFIE